MKKIIVLSAIIFAFAGCRKEGASGNKPKISFVSVSAEEAPVELQSVMFKIRVQDGDGDLRYIYINDHRVFEDTIRFDQRDFPDLQTHSGINLDAEIELLASDLGPDIFVRLRGGDLINRPNPDTMQLRIYVEDKKKNVSDTIVMPKVVIRR